MSHIALPIAELKPALLGLGKIVCRRSTLPILNHIKIERTRDGWIALTATDLDRHVTVRLEQPAEGESLALLVPYDELQKIAKACAKEDLIVLQSGEGSAITLQYPIGKQTVSAEIESLPATEFPEVPKIKGDSVPVPDLLRTSIQQAMECSSTDETRYILNGAYIDVSDSKCHHVVATDGRVLYGSNSFSLPLENSVIIPRHPFLGWKEFNHDGEWQLRVAPKLDGDSAPNFQITTRRWRFISRQIEGNYPNWRQVLPDPASFRSSFGIPERTLENVLQTIARMPCDDSKSHRLGLEFKGRKLRLLGKSPGATDWTRVEVSVTDAMGKDVTIFIDRRYLSTALRFGLNFIDATDQFAPVRVSNGGRLMLIMPVRVDTAQQVGEPGAATTTGPDAPSAALPEAAESHHQNGDAVSGVSGPEPDSQVRKTHPDKPAAVPFESMAAPPERSNMINDTTSSIPAGPNGATTVTAITTEAAPTNDIDVVLDVIEDLRESLTTNLADLKSVTARLKQIKREQKAGEREMQSVRQTLRSLQGVKL